MSFGGIFGGHPGSAANEGGTPDTGDITRITSTDMTVTITNPTGPTVDLSVPAAAAILSINGDTTAAQSIGGAGGITVATAAGATTVDGGRLVANWTVGVCRVYAVDGVNGNDANAGFADPATSSAGDYAIACAAAGVVAKKTMAGLAAIFPRDGAGRTVEIVIAAATYAGSPADFLNGVIGYVPSITVRGTGTNATAGSVAFAGSTAEATYVGGVSATGLNAPGYNPASGITTSQMTMAKVGGGTPAWGTRPALPVGMRLRGDSATTTAALRNISRQACNSSGGDTVLFQTVFPALPVVSDVFYAEQPGVLFSGAMLLLAPGNQSIIFAGMGWLSTVTTVARCTFAFCSMASSFATSSNRGVSEATGVQQNYTHPVLGNLTVGGGLRVATTASISSSTAVLSGLVSVTDTTMSPATNSFWGAGCAARSMLYVTPASNQALTGAPNLGTTATVGIPYTFGVGTNAGVQITGSICQMGTMQIEGSTAKPALGLFGKCSVTFSGVVGGSTGNTDVGLDLQNSTESTLVYANAVRPTVTGTLGDIRYANQALGVWTNLNFEEMWDVAGNHLQRFSVSAGTIVHTIDPSVYAGVVNNGGPMLGFTLVRNDAALGSGQVIQAIADTLLHAQGLAGVLLADANNGAACLYGGMSGYKLMRFDALPTLAAIAYLSDSLVTPGVATTTVPAVSAVKAKLRLGRVVDIASFAGNLAVVRMNPELLAVLADGLA